MSTEDKYVMEFDAETVGIERVRLMRVERMELIAAKERYNKQANAHIKALEKQEADEIMNQTPYLPFDKPQVSENA